MIKTSPNLSIEAEHSGIIVGVDEAGRGPLAGPVVAAAAIIDEKALKLGINDSKKLSKVKREAIFKDLSNNYQTAVGIASVEEIDEINILKATMLAMKRAIEGLNVQYSIVLIDGNTLPWRSNQLIPIIKGDQKSASIAAASIIAKVTRDRIMHKLSEEFPEYLWHKNSGYGTKDHIDAIRKFGPNIHHRRKFIEKILSQD